MRKSIPAGLLGVLVGSLGVVSAGPDGQEIPPPFQPFEHMIGSWKGQGIPKANRLRGWPEKHMWAWKFAKGVPVGMSLVLEGDKALSKAELTCDVAGRQYRLEGTDPEGKAVAYLGSYGAASGPGSGSGGKMLTLDRVGNVSGGKERLILWPSSNQIRYVLWLERQDAGAPQFNRVVEVGLTKEGEAFAAGGSSSDLPKCIITGGAASMTIAFQGKSYPICCSGCRDEFNDNPEKYVKKAAQRAETSAGATAAKAAAPASGKDDGAFAGFGGEEKPRPKAAPAPAAPEPVEAPRADDGAAKGEARAASLLRLGQNLEKAGKTASALSYYRQVVKEYPATASFATAAARIKAHGGH
jgi:YHS domain-containing protein